jgi:hypothetical protein
MQNKRPRTIWSMILLLAAKLDCRFITNIEGEVRVYSKGQQSPKGWQDIDETYFDDIEQ